METKANYVLLGAATIVGFVLIMLVAMWLANSEYSRGYSEYDVVFDDPVRGLAEGGEVRFNGIKVGEVQQLSIDPDNTNRVIARIRVSGGIPLREDSEAQLEPIGLTGVTLIQLSAGTPAAKVLRSDPFSGQLPRIRGRGSQIDIIVARSEDIVMRASEAMAAVRDLLTDDNIAKVSSIITDLDAVSNRLAKQGSVIDESARTARAMTDASEALAALAKEMNADISDLDVAVAKVNSAATVASDRTLPQIGDAAESLAHAADAIQRVAEEIQANPSPLTPRAPRPTVELSQ
jgi:phospholipid/cholesterol/gamma-HCH transport system substrate-binding protein